MKPNKKGSSHSDEENVRYKLNLQYFNNQNGTNLVKAKETKRPSILPPTDNEEHNVFYKFPDTKLTTKTIKPKQKIKVNFWSNKNAVNRVQKNKGKDVQISRRHTICTPAQKSENSKPVKVRKRVSFLPTPIFTENHIPMVTVPDELTINLNEEEANELRDDLNSATVNNHQYGNMTKQKSRSSTTQTSPKSKKRNSPDVNRSEPNENELEFFTKYVVHKLRRMETNQRIYSENLINTVLMLGQFGKLNGKSRIADV